MLHSDDIALAKSLIANIHQSLEPNDQIQAAYQWLDAQMITKEPLKNDRHLSGLIGDWSGQVITPHDVEIAALLHQGIKGIYPHLQISPGFVLPSAERLRRVCSSFTHHIEERLLVANYQYYETVTYTTGDDLGIIRNFERKWLPEAYYDPNDFCATHDDCTCYYCMFGR